MDKKEKDLHPEESVLPDNLFESEPESLKDNPNGETICHADFSDGCLNEDTDASPPIQGESKMKTINLAIIYYSMTGNNYKMAQWAEEAAIKAGANVRLLKVMELVPAEITDSNAAWKSHIEESRHIPEAQNADLEWADAILFSTPTRYGNVASQMKQFFDGTGGLWGAGKLADKVVSAMTSAQNPHGGQEQTILQLYTTMYHWGAIVAAPGYTDPVLFAAGGNPYGVSATVGSDGMVDADKVREAVCYQTERTIQVARRFHGAI